MDSVAHCNVSCTQSWDRRNRGGGRGVGVEEVERGKGMDDCAFARIGMGWVSIFLLPVSKDDGPVRSAAASPTR